MPNQVEAKPKIAEVFRVKNYGLRLNGSGYGLEKK
jgi:hypothetical protein